MSPSSYNYDLPTKSELYSNPGFVESNSMTMFDELREAITGMMSEENLTNLLVNLSKFTTEALMTTDGLRIYTMHFAMHTESYTQLTELSNKLTTYLRLENKYERVLTALVNVFKKQDENLLLNVYGENIPDRIEGSDLNSLLLNNKELMTLLIVLLTIVI